MTEGLHIALDKVEMTYSDLVQIANEMIEPVVTPVNKLIEELNTRVHNLSLDDLREYILRLQLMSFSLGDIKEKSSLKTDISEALQKEAFAISFNSLEGSATVKEKLALVATSRETVTTILYNLVSSLLKTKLDETHRIIDSCKSILLSRMQEQKFMNLGIPEDPESYRPFSDQNK